jgi:hypothetical protein
MTDLARCADISCPMREDCKRFTMLPSESGWQYYTQGRRQTDTSCLDFVQADKRKTPKPAAIINKPKPSNAAVMAAMII